MMITEDRVREALDDLDRAQAQIVTLLPDAVLAENHARCAQAELDEAKRRLEEAVTNATAVAMFSAEPVVDGKNAEVRKAQLDHFLLHDAQVANLRQQMELLEAAVLDAQNEVEEIKARARVATMGASLAQHRAELLAAWCRLVASPAAEPVTHGW